MRKVTLMAVAILFLFFPIATALDCHELKQGDFEICKSIQQNPSLTTEEKDLLILDIFNPNKTTPNYNFVYMWNTNLNIKNSPNNKEQNKGTIKNAWLSIITLMPSILEDNILYTPKNGKLQTEYNYDVVLPSGKQKRDCKTKYYLEQNLAELRIYLNGKPIGNNKINSFSLKKDYANFIVVLDIKIRYRIKHYRKNDNGCKYHHSNYITDTLTLTDKFNAKVYPENLESSFKITNKHHGIIEGELIANNFTSLELSFKDSFFKKTHYVYTLDYSLPYYVITLKANKIENTKIQNLKISNKENEFYFVVSKPENCKIKISNHFYNLIRNCNFDYSESGLKIKTDKLNYDENETITIEVFPKDKFIELSYANQTARIKNNAKFKAVLNYNKITAKLEDSQTQRIINVVNSQNKKLAIDLSSFGLFGYVIYSFLKKYSFNLI